MPRPFWKGVISFGLVVIPVRMYVATTSRTLSLHLLHKKCLTRPKQVLHCDPDNEYFTIKDTVRAFEYAKGQYVVLDQKDFNKVPVRTKHSMDILGFVREDEIDPIYFSESHYLEPEELALKSFALLREALKKTGRVGIAKVSFQKREHLTCLRPKDDSLILHTLHYADEIWPRSELAPPHQEITPNELDMATNLVNTMQMAFHPEKYHDEYYDGLKEIIEAKIKGQEIKTPKAPKVEMADLMSALRASIEAAQKKSESEKVGAGAGGNR